METLLPPQRWAAEAARIGYRAVTWPVGADADRSVADLYLRTAKEKDIVIAEVGAWCNTLSPDEGQRRENMEHTKRCLAVAEEIGARCCVNISGARGDIWDGGYADNYSEDTYGLIVDSVREIIDAVRPKRTFYTLEPMPWMLPDSAESYIKLIEDIDRPAFGVHLDFVNLINTPRKFLQAGAFVEDCLKKLGPYVKSVHIKDAAMDGYKMPCQILECAPGEGMLDYSVILRLLHRLLDADMPVLLEHMSTVGEYERAFRYLEGVAAENNIPL